jgi:indolepyruvate ferredoxin oxidoreductase
LDPFGRSELRRLERLMIEEYEEAVGVVIRAFEAGNLSLEKSEQIVSLPDTVRGFEALKLRRATAYRARLSASIEPFRI